ncbi:paraquat-inducible protein A [Marinivivus vitaminiproducens]|uniref:paraquat-inducible protein A n=1 Tax=Marinivivus vitaminiproducens TaxID=3035935 RepID=UPI0027A1D982|nr:paraquat-inducible protein A [Geminicoccaceae bacterium SCSIO 64248]
MGHRPDNAAALDTPMIAASSIDTHYLATCHDCDLVQQVSHCPVGGIARCARCDAKIYTPRHNGIENSLMLTLAALCMFVVAVSFPIMSMTIEGQTQEASLWSAVVGMEEAGMPELAILVFLTAIGIPFLKLAAMIYVLVPVRSGRRPPGLGWIFRLIGKAGPWAMTEVFLLGLIVAYVKLVDLAQVQLGIALFAFVAQMFLMAAADAALDRYSVWALLGPQRRATGVTDVRKLVGCHSCGQVLDLPERPRRHLVCPRCHASVHHRKPNSIARTWALLLTAAILYVPANLYPVMSVIYFGRGEPDTILSGVVTLVQAGMIPVAALVFFASITVPLAKLAGLSYLLLSVQRGWIRRPRDRTRLYRLIEFIGRWSMIDVFMISILVALVSLGAIATIEPGIGAVAFASVVVITMLASMSFDPRLIWDALETDHG